MVGLSTALVLKPKSLTASDRASAVPSASQSYSVRHTLEGAFDRYTVTVNHTPNARDHLTCPTGGLAREW